MYRLHYQIQTITSCSTCCLFGPVRATWVSASLNSIQVIISCSTCCLFGTVRATWVCASFNSIQVIISCSTCCLFGPVRATWVCASTAADDDLYRVEACTDPCGSNQSDEAASTAADDDFTTRAMQEERVLIIMGKTSPNILVCTFSTTYSGALRSNFSSRLVNELLLVVVQLIFRQED